MTSDAARQVILACFCLVSVMPTARGNEQDNYNHSIWICVNRPSGPVTLRKWKSPFRVRFAIRGIPVQTPSLGFSSGAGRELLQIKSE